MKKGSKLTAEQVHTVLANWPGLNAHLMQLNIIQVQQLIDIETERHEPRCTFLSRLVKRKYVLLRREEFKQLGLKY